jgi:hypothetical protein
MSGNQLVKNAERINITCGNRLGYHIITGVALFLNKPSDMKKINLLPCSLISQTLVTWSLSGMLMILSSGCSKEVPLNNNMEPLYALDKEVFFSIQTASGIYSNYGYRQINVINTSGGQIIYIQKMLDSGGVPVINIRIGFNNDLHYGGGGWFGSTPSGYLNLGNCKGEIYLSKSGTEITGKYQSHPEKNSIYLINPGTQNQEKFAMDSSAVDFKIANEGQLSHGGDFVEGNFSCDLFSYINGSSPIPANFSFRLVVIQ